MDIGPTPVPILSDAPSDRDELDFESYGDILSRIILSPNELTFAHPLYQCLAYHDVSFFQNDNCPYRNLFIQ